MPAAPPRLTGVLETVLYYTDEAAAEEFYGGILGFRLIGRERGRSLFYRAGASVFLLFDAAATLVADRLPPHGATGPGHTCFLVGEAEYEPWKTYLEGRGIAVVQEVRWSPSALSFYFRDPDGNVLEIANGDLWPV